MRAVAFFAAVSIATLSTGQSLAQDAAAGEKVFAKCKACHVVDEDKNKIGPSLKGVIGRTAGTHAGFKYSPAMVEAGKAGLGLGRRQADGISSRPQGHDQRHEDGVSRPEEGRGSRQRHRLSQAIPLIARFIPHRVRPDMAGRPDCVRRRSAASGGGAQVRLSWPPAGPAGCRRPGRRQALQPDFGYSRRE